MRQGLIDYNNKNLLVLCERCEQYESFYECSKSKRDTYICYNCELQPPPKKQKKLTDYCNDLNSRFKDIGLIDKWPSKTFNSSGFVPHNIKIVLPPSTIFN